MQKVAFLGLGIMGSGMAENVLKAGFPLAVYNRTSAKAQSLVAQGARLAATPRDAAQGADVILSMVGDDDASRAVWLGDSDARSGALAGAGPKAVLVECSTLSVAWVRELAQLAAQHGHGFLDAPVSGSKDAAASGTLRLMVGGDAATLEQVRPVLQTFGQDITYMGPSGSGAVMKLINNMMGAVHAAALAEGLVLAERAGLDMKTFVAQITSGAVSSPIVKGKTQRMVDRDFEDTHFSLRWMHKDATYALRIADELGSALPTVAVAREIYRMARNMGLGDADFSAVVEVLRRK
jgi:3-hydroxyisobutyrate dehydrogenase